MAGKTAGSVKLLETEIGHSLMNFHCIINQESLYAKILSFDLNEVMTTVVQIVNFLIACFSLTYRRFREFLNDMDSAYRDLVIHSLMLVELR